VVAAICAAVALVVAGCLQQQPTSPGSASPDPTASAATASNGGPSGSALALAKDAIATSEQLPPAPPGTLTDAAASYTATGSDISAPWTQFMICTTTGRADDGPPSLVEPDAVAAAWGFGRAGAAQVDQYAIVYTSPEAAAAAVERSRALAADCDAALAATIPSGKWQLELGKVPPGVSGFLTSASHQAGISSRRVSHNYSTVMAAGPVVHYMRFAPMSPDEGVRAPEDLPAEYRDGLMTAVAANLLAATGSPASSPTASPTTSPTTQPS
jgi:hypothetical protein